MSVKRAIIQETWIKIVLTTITFVVLVWFMAGPGKAGPAQQAQKEVPRPIEKGQGLKLVGALTETIAFPAIEAGVKCHESFIRIKDESSDAHLYAGIPLWLLVGRVDDQVQHEEDAFNDTLADEGYKVIVIGAHGERVVFASQAVARDDSIILAIKKDGKPLTDGEGPLKLIGLKFSENQIIENVIEIRIANAQ